jgi:ATP-binding cassette, subfamily B, multidrug efflux pump
LESKSGNIFDFSLTKRILRGAAPYRARYTLTGLLVVVLAALGPVRPALIQVAVDEHIPNHNMDGLLFIFLLVSGLMMLEAVMQFYQTYLANWVAESVTLDLRSQLFRHVMGFRLRYFDRTPVGQFVTRLIGDIDGIAQIFSDGFLNIFGDILKLVAIIGYMLWLDWQLTLVVLIPVPVLIIATRIFQLAIKKAFNDVRNQVARMNVFIQEHVTGMSIIRIFGMEKAEKAKFSAINREHMEAHIRSVWAFSIFFPVVELLSAASVSLLLWWGMRGVLSESLSLGVLLQFILYVFMLYRPIRMLADRFNVLQMGIVNAERVFKVLDTADHTTDSGTISREQVRGDIEFRNVWFAYKDEDWVLRDVSFRVSPGETVAIVGHTGAGKSSVINLLTRFYEHQRGSILLDETPVEDYRLDNLRSHVAVVLQDVFLFSDSILNNITLRYPSITREQVIEAAKAVGAHEFIMRMPGGYDYNAMERGSMLSVGQRQLISFIRAYVANPSILVLDEASSSVDTESELLIQQAIERLTRGRTSIVIAHRLSTVRHADRIIVMDRGQIIEHGTHQQLLDLGGVYKRLFELQFD